MSLPYYVRDHDGCRSRGQSSRARADKNGGSPVRRGTNFGIRMQYMSLAAGTEIVASHASSSCTSSLSLTRQEISGVAGYNIVMPSSKIFRSCELRRIQSWGIKTEMQQCEMSYYDIRKSRAIM